MGSGEAGRPELSYADVQHLVVEAYIPFAGELRAIPWPDQEGRMENDAEHSFSLAFIGASLGERIGLDPAKIALFATYHDFVERYAGDTSVWDDERAKSKHERERKALEVIKSEHATTPVIGSVIEQYESRDSEEARFVYSLDKLLPYLMIVQDLGKFWKSEGITFEVHQKKAAETRNKVAGHTAVLGWFDETMAFLEENREDFFAPAGL